MAKRGPKPNSYSATEADYATTYQLEHIRCGKANCHTCTDGAGHGPYWYAYHYSPTSRRRTKKYIGKHLPPDVEQQKGPSPKQ
jgi:hypothetical protein